MDDLLETYADALADIAHRLVLSDNPDEIHAGARMLVCIECNRRALDQSCRDCEMAVDNSTDDGLALERRPMASGEVAIAVARAPEK